jgi:uncharacterized lipoprotein NlpE involved in copper resistance
MNPKLIWRECFMKKTVLYTMLLLLVMGIMGCSNKKESINVEDVTVSTILAKTNGKLQVATVEDFGKTYYKLSELQDYITGEVSSYNKKAGGEKITIDDIQLREGKAIMLLTYTGMDQYAAFNKVTAAYFNGGVKDNPLKLPATLISTKNKSLASTEEVLQNDKYKIIVMNEPYEIIVDGKVKYYSDNAKLLDDNKVQSAAEGMTIVVFKP